MLAHILDEVSVNLSQALEPCATPCASTDQEDFALKARNIETLSKAKVKNTLLEWVEPKQIKNLI